MPELTVYLLVALLIYPGMWLMDWHDRYCIAEGKAMAEAPTFSELYCEVKAADGERQRHDWWPLGESSSRCGRCCVVLTTVFPERCPVCLHPLRGHGLVCAPLAGGEGESDG